ncbi:class I SAM-dependent methyltransferase [Actinokineospora enzanensis]|uniref:class I SAM-dependent methyltransferase n=1 Tax=Actinokineospora enzanensis TaxID=155975 RepID=UPI0003606E3A|nr:class I SAM-dependent methyltransferase [Actinokineospora enzanensis]
MTDTSSQSPAEFWESFYQEREQVWSGNVNGLLVREVADEAPGSALDLGCAEGGDAIWLAERGWRVTAVDISETALGRAAKRATEVGAEVDWRRVDLGESFPDGEFDLVFAAYFHSPVERAGERAGALRRAAQAVRSGGVLLVIGHAGWPSWITEPAHEHRFPTTADVLQEIGQADGGWRVETEEVVESPMKGPDGQDASRVDNVVKVRRV